MKCSFMLRALASDLKKESGEFSRSDFISGWDEDALFSEVINYHENCHKTRRLW